MARWSFKNLKGLLVPFFLAGCLIGGYWIYWTKAAGQIETQVRAAIPTNAASAVTVTGFPYRLTLTIKDLNLQTQNGLTFKASSVIATATPFNPLLWVLEGALDPALALPGRPVHPLKAVGLKASVRAHPKGLERFSLTFDSLQAQGPGGWEVGKGLFHLMTRFEDDNTLAMVVDLTQVRIARPLEGPAAILGQTINHVFISGPIDQRSSVMKSLSAWRAAGGKLTIMAGEIIWGPISLTNAKGNLSLSPTNKWQGDIAGQGALKPEGIPVTGLSAPVRLEIREGRLSLGGLPGLNIADSFQ
jgi:hypothetical protein